jgi:hypothetical protein
MSIESAHYPKDKAMENSSIQLRLPVTEDGPIDTHILSPIPADKAILAIESFISVLRKKV